MKKRLFLYILPFAFCIACIDELDRELKDIEPQIVVNSFFCQGEPFKVFLSKSFSPFHTQFAEMIKDAQVTIYENNKNIGKLSFQTESFTRYEYFVDDVDTIIYTSTLVVDSFFTNPIIIPQLGCEYRIEVEMAGFRSVSATSSIPKLVPIKEVNKKIRYTSIEGWAVEKGMPFYEVVFKDLPENNYYLFSILAINDKAIHADLSYRVPVSYYSDDLVIGRYDRESNMYDPLFFSFSDRLFNGNEYSLTLFINENYTLQQAKLRDSLEINLLLNNLGNDFEHYLKSLQESEDQSKNPLSEPVSIYSNVENGLGVFAGYACAKKQITIYKTK